MFAGIADEAGRPLLRALFVAFADDVRIEVVAELGADDNFVALLLERLCQDLFAVAFAVGVAGVEEVDAQVERAPKQSDALRLFNLAPPISCDSPHAKTHFGYGEIGFAKLSVLQLNSL